MAPGGCTKAGISDGPNNRVRGRNGALTVDILGTTLQSILVTPHYDKRLHVSSWRVEITYQSHPSEYGESVSLSVIIPGGDRSIAAIQREAIERARQLFSFAMNSKAVRAEIAL